MGIARVLVSANLLRRWLHWPEGVDVCGAAYDPASGLVTFLAVGEGLPELPADGFPVVAWPSYAVRNTAPRGRPASGEVIFCGWHVNAGKGGGGAAA